jgi:hypothetical protein
MISIDYRLLLAVVFFVLFIVFACLAYQISTQKSDPDRNTKFTAYITVMSINIALFVAAIAYYFYDARNLYNQLNETNPLNSAVKRVFKSGVRDGSLSYNGIISP